MPILRAELEGLVAAGAEFIQIDDPSPAIHPDAPSDFAALFNAAVAPVRGSVRLGAHLCFGNYLGRPLAKRTYRPGARRDARVRLSTSWSSSSRTGRWPRSRSWARSRRRAGMSPRASSTSRTRTSRPRTTSQNGPRRSCAAGVPAERLTLVPDCGFSQTARHLTTGQAPSPRRRARPRARSATRDPNDRLTEETWTDTRSRCSGPG